MHVIIELIRAQTQPDQSVNDAESARDCRHGGALPAAITSMHAVAHSLRPQPDSGCGRHVCSGSSTEPGGTLLVGAGALAVGWRKAVA